MEEFAQVSGISRPTISKFFNDPSSVRASLKSKIEAALEKTDGMVSQASDALKLRRTTLIEKMKKYGISK